MGIVIETRELRRHAVRLVRRPDTGGVIGDRAGRRGHGIADERVVPPALLPAAVEPDPAARVPGAVGARVPERPVVAPRCPAHRLQVRPRIGRGSGLEVDEHEAPGEQTVVAGVPLDHDRAARVGRDRHPFRLPRRFVEGPRRPRPQVEPCDHALVPARSGVIAGHDRDDDGVSVPIDLPHAEVGRTHLGDLARGQLDQEEAPPGVAGAPDDRIGCRTGTGHGARAPIQPVRSRIGGEHQETPPIARPRDALGRAGERRGQLRLPAVRVQRVGQLMPRRDPVREERETRTVR